MLLLGGFAIAAALSKHALAKRGATWILARVGGRPATVLLTNMLVGLLPEHWTAALGVRGAAVLLTDMRGNAFGCCWRCLAKAGCKV